MKYYHGHPQHPELPLKHPIAHTPNSRNSTETRRSMISGKTIQRSIFASFHYLRQSYFRHEPTWEATTRIHIVISVILRHLKISLKQAMAHPPSETEINPLSCDSRRADTTVNFPTILLSSSYNCTFEMRKCVKKKKSAIWPSLRHLKLKLPLEHAIARPPNTRIRKEAIVCMMSGKPIQRSFFASLNYLRHRCVEMSLCEKQPPGNTSSYQQNPDTSRCPWNTPWRTNNIRNRKEAVTDSKTI